MSEKQVIEEYNLKPWDVAEAMRAAGYDVPGTPSEMEVTSREGEEVLTLRYVREFHPLQRGMSLGPTDDIIANKKHVSG